MRYIGHVLCVVVLVAMLLMCLPAEQGNQYLRIHIRANSNVDIDQSIKYQVKAAVVDHLTPLLTSAVDKAAAMDIVSQELDNVRLVSDQVLLRGGLDYVSSVKLANEYFPARTYDDVTLGEDFYDALIIELGQASGDNWWCVVYPPLCFVNKNPNSLQDIVYRSKLVEIIKNFFG